MNKPFLKLIQTGSTAEVADAVKDDPSLAHWCDPQGVSALLWSIYSGQQLVREFLLSSLFAQAVDLDIFEAAAAGDNERLLAILHANPSAVQAFSDDGWTPLHLAAAFGTPAAVATLLNHGAEVDAVSSNPQRNRALHAALALSGNLETVKLLLEHGADANAVQAGGFTPIFSAAAANRRDFAELLLVHGAHPRPKSDQGKTPSDFARERGHAELAAWLDSQPA